uniref:Uncharacterized protein n=1 Tax=Aegilops tauschii subsp. strangulata TaxID=200361 RepID=A0A452ZG58_AEGTS
MQRSEPRRSEWWRAVCSTGAFYSAGIVVFRLGFIVQERLILWDGGSILLDGAVMYDRI